MRRNIIIILIVIVFSFHCSGCQGKNEQSTNLKEVELEKPEEEPQAEEQEAEEESIYVYVCGAVMQEGVYELAGGSRVYEAVEKAGGFTEEAAVSKLNQAALLKDEDQLYVPTLEEAENQIIQAGESSMDNGKVNLNTATKEELMTLSGIGEAKAESIIRYREEQGKFQSIEDIKQIEGIKDGVFQKIKELITI